MSTLLKLQPGSLASGYCYPSSPQTLLNDFLAISSAVFGGNFQTFNYGDSTPAAADRDKPWIRTVSQQLDGLYVYYNGKWSRPHPVPASSKFRAMWVGTTTELLTFDGGVNEAVSDTTGPFWEVDTDFDARSPMGPGTLSGSGTVIAVGTNYGNERETLTTGQLPAHTHNITAKTGLDIDGAREAARTLFGEGETDPNEFSSERPTKTTGSGTPVNIVHPIRGAYLIKRTARIYYTA